MKTIAIVVAGVSLLACATGAHARGGAPKKKAGPEPVTVTGCVHKGAQPYCWSLQTKEGVGYSFAGYPATDGECYSITGAPTLGACRQGTQLGVTKLEKQKVNCCNPPAPPPEP